MPEFYHAKSAVPAADGQRHVMIAVPAINIEGAHYASMVRAIPRVNGMGVATDFYLLKDCCHVDDARNICVKAFLDLRDCTDLLFVDADVGFAPEALYRLCSHAGDIVAGVYPRKEIARSYPIAVDGDVASADENGMITEGVLSVPAGFLRISRRVLEHMTELSLDRTFRSAEGGDSVPILFERGLHHGNRLSGDVAFCWRARELGYAIHVDASLTLIHEGPARFAGCLLRDLAASSQSDASEVPSPAG